MKSLLTTCILAMFAWLVGCDLNDDQYPNNGITGTGPVVSKTLNLQPFDKIENNGVADFYVTLGSPQSVELSSHQNIIDVMTYKVVNNTLVIGLQENTSIRSADEIRFDITINEIQDIKLVGIGSFELNGDFQDELVISLIGVGNVDAYNLEVGNCKIVSTGVGDCEVLVRDELDVSILGVGSVYYRGNPAITESVTGVGKLINDN